MRTSLTNDVRQENGDRKEKYLCGRLSSSFRKEKRTLSFNLIDISGSDHPSPGWARS